MKPLLVVAFHFPPHHGSSGIQRTLRLVRDLPALGWSPLVLTAAPMAYESQSNDLLNDIPEGVPVIRALAWDAARHLSIRGRYPQFLAIPDRWSSWYPAALACGLAMIRKYRPRAIWSTFPIATAHKVASTLAKTSGLKWMADFRDPMAQPGYPEDRATWNSYSNIERSAVQRARVCTFTTPSAVDTYKNRYPESAGKFHLVENGYDEDSFNGIARQVVRGSDRLTILHSGIVYPSERDPSQLLKALRRLKLEQPRMYGKLRVVFRAPGKYETVSKLSLELELDDAVEVLPSITYRAALQEMVDADALLLLQASNCNSQIPAKLYEYLRACRPILALTDKAGDTALKIREAGLDTIADLSSADDIYRLLLRFVHSPESLVTPRIDQVRKSSRRSRAECLVELLEQAGSD